ncbi:MAG: hypothetical protein IPO98_03595 [Saprospiraceae bacterium]|nr:hypothetical protein [Saprospiraceae bacterium]
MEYKKFEKHISDTLRHDEAGLDMDAFIRGLHVDKNERRFPVWFWFSTGLVLLALIGYMYIPSGNTALGRITTVETKTKINDIQASTQLNSGQKEKEHQNKFSALNSGNFRSGLLNGSAVDANTEKYPKNRTNTKAGIYKSFTKSDIEPSTISSEIIREVNNHVESRDEKISALSLTSRMEKYSISSLAYNPKNIFSKNISKVTSDNIICPTFRKKGNYYFEVLPEIGYFRPIKSLEQTSNEPDNIYNLRKNNESTLEGLNAGLYVRISKQKLPFYIQAGASFSRMTEKMALDYSYTKSDTTKGIISITQSQSGDTITVIYGDIVQETKISGKKVNHHQFSLIDFPVSLGVEKSFGTWSAGIEGGVIINMSLISSGQILASDTSFVAVDEPFAAYKNKIGASYFGGIHLSKSFYNTGRFYVALRGRYIPEAFSTDQNRIRQSYHFVGVNFGYVYLF